MLAPSQAAEQRGGKAESEGRRREKEKEGERGGESAPPGAPALLPFLVPEATGGKEPVFWVPSC